MAMVSVGLSLSGSVGLGGINHQNDVTVVQNLINQKLHSPIRLIKVDGVCGAFTILAIEYIQFFQMGIKHPDGKITPHGQTFLFLTGNLLPGLPLQIQPLVEAQNSVMTNSRYTPDTPSAGTTHCSEAAYDTALQMDLNVTNVLGDARAGNYSANTQIDNLGNPMNGWNTVTPEQAQALANRGILVFVTQSHSPHGHIASVRPEGVPGDTIRGLTGPLLANVGTFNGVAHQSVVFAPKYGKIVYYAPKQ